MSFSGYLFCAPEFAEDLVRHFPGVPVQPFASEVTACRQSFSSLHIARGANAVMLFAAPETVKINGPVKDHINLSAENPLIGPADLVQGPRFPDMSSVYGSPKGEAWVVVLGSDPDLENFKEPWARVEGGVWEALLLAHRGCSIKGWLISDLEKWVKEQTIIH